MMTKVAALAVVVLAGSAVGRVAPETKREAKVMPRGPLAGGLPSKATGAHIERIKALGDNAWLNLGKPAPDPKWGTARGRSYTNKMAFAPDLRCAFLYGEGVHGYVKPDGRYMDDFWAYDINAHRWVCLYPGTNTKTVTMKLDENNFEVTEGGEHVPIAAMVHGYEQMSYDTDLKKFMFVACPGAYWRKSLKKRRAAWLKDIKDPTKPRRNPWFYDVRAARWERRKVASGPAGIGFCKALVYVPSKKQTLYYARKKDVWFYDDAKNAWTNAKPKGPSPATKDYEGLVCFDAKRDRLYVFNDKMVSVPFIYDVKANAWIDPKPKGQPLTAADRVLRSASAGATYDSVNDVIVLQLRRRSKTLGTFVYDCRANTWTEKPISTKVVGQNGFYDPDLNVHFYFDAGDSRTTPGNFWVYRYRRAASRAAAAP